MKRQPPPGGRGRMKPQRGVSRRGGPLRRAAGTMKRQSRGGPFPTILLIHGSGRKPPPPDVEHLPVRNSPTGNCTQDDPDRAVMSR